MKVRLVRKASTADEWAELAKSVRPIDVEIAKTVEVSGGELDALLKGLLVDKDYVRDNNHLAADGSEGAPLRVLAITASGRDEIVITDPSGYGYCRYVAIVSKSNPCGGDTAEENADGGRRKLGVTYRMEKKNETAESYVEIPMTEQAYRTIVHTDSKSGKSLERILSELAKLQGYDKIVAVSFDIEAEV